MHRVVFQIGSFTLYSYGVFVAFGFLLGSSLILRQAKKKGFDSGSISDCLTAVLIGGLLGGRLLFVLINWQQYSQNILRIFMIYEGGLAVQGAVVMGILSVALISHIRKLSFWKVSDLIAPYVALGQAMGRIGCFLNGCCYGKPIESGIGVTLRGESFRRIPTQIYSSIGLFFIFILLLWIRKKHSFDGRIFIVYIMLYSGFRFFMDFLRGDELALIYGVKLSQAIGALMFAAAAGLYAILRRRGQGVTNEKT
ncbi:MAG: prolipoprotein diacylglyceryl transferase [Candidatus Omnitrophota bacterium]